MIETSKVKFVEKKSGKQCFVVPTKLKGRFPLLRKPAFCLLVAAPPIPFDRTINCAAARPADASGSMDSSTLFMLFSFLRFTPVGAKQMIDVCFHGQQLFHLIAGFAIIGIGRFFLCQKRRIFGL